VDSSDEEDEEVHENGEDIVLNEIGDEEESEESEAEQVSFTRSGRSTGNKRRMESDWMFYGHVKTR